MSTDDALFRFRLRVFSLAEEVGVRAACRTFGIHPSTYYRWRRQVLRHGLEMLRPRERRQPRMPNATAPFVEQRVVAFALGIPASDRCASRSSSPGRSGAGSSSRPTESGGCSAATA